MKYIGENAIKKLIALIKGDLATKQPTITASALTSQSAYYEASIKCTGQAANSLTFTADTIPTADLTVYVVIQEVTQG